MGDKNRARQIHQSEKQPPSPITYRNIQHLRGGYLPSKPEVVEALDGDCSSYRDGERTVRLEVSGRRSWGFGVAASGAAGAGRGASPR